MKTTMCLDDNVVYQDARNRFRNVIRVGKNRMINCNGEPDCECKACYDDRNFKRSEVSTFACSSQKKIKLESLDNGSNDRRHHYNLKLFDRTVDVSAFTELTSLYPICREWIKNKPSKRNSFHDRIEKERKEDVSKQLKDKENGGVYQLPPPKPSPMRYDAYGNRNHINNRVPRPLPTTVDHTPIWAYIYSHAFDDDRLPFPPVLFQNHLTRWKLIRRRWNQACLQNEDRFKTSFDIIQGMHKQFITESHQSN